MHLRYFNYVLIGTLIFLLSCSDQKEENTSFAIPEDTMFELMDNDSTGISFKNVVEERIDRTHIVFNTLYNGGGVALGDFNNDELLDILFTANDTHNELYINKGNLKFEEVSEISGIRSSGWHTGASVVDINSDGLLDIYICRGGHNTEEDERANLLYINKGDLKFEEEAEKYGLNDKGYSYHSSFFDYDNDGDLDVYIINHPDKSGLMVPQYRIGENNGSWFSKDHLYRNDNGYYTDVSEEAGIYNNYGFGLSLITADFNGDNYDDIYVANDYLQKDYLFLNNADGTFTESVLNTMNHISLFSMGSDYADINNDGYEDLFVSEMLPEDYKRSKTTMANMSTRMFNSMVRNKLHYQYMHNVLQLNRGNGLFSEVSQMAGISKTDWSWASFLSDFDNDGLRDLFVSNGYRRDVYDKDSGKLRDEYVQNTSKEEFDLKTFLSFTPSNKLNNYVYKNTGDLKFVKKVKEWGFENISFSNGASVGDLDNDGDLDVVVNNLIDEAFVYKNNADKLENKSIRIKLIGPEKNPLGIGAKVTIYHGDQKQYFQNKLTRGYLSSTDPIIHFGCQQVDLIDKIEVRWHDGKISSLSDVTTGSLVNLEYANAESVDKPIAADNIFNEVENIVPGILHKENIFNDFKDQVLLPHKVSTLGPTISVGDLNGDDLDDFYFGGAKNQEGKIYLQKEDGSFSLSYNNAFINDSSFEDVSSCLFDLDMDGDLDLYVVSGDTESAANSLSYLDRVYINDGKGVFTRNVKALPAMPSSGSCVEKTDFDNDGDMDLFVGGRVIPNQYPKAPRSYLLENRNGVLIDVTAEKAPELSEIGMVTSAVWSDMDNNGKQDLIVVGEWMPIRVFLNTGSKFKESSKKYGLDNSAGWWNKIVSYDLDKDGDEDYVLGNIGLNYKFKASEAKPFHIYSSDFDKNGTYDIVLAKYYGQDKVPVRGKQCTSEQMPFINEKFPSYHDFAEATLDQILDLEAEEVLHLQAKQFASIILWNDDNNLRIEKLPIEAQFSAANSILINDFDGDQKTDILIAGNMFDSEVETTRADASLGVLIRGSEDGNFSTISNSISGLDLNYDVRNLVPITINGNPYILVAVNDDELRCLSY